MRHFRGANVKVGENKGSSCSMRTAGVLTAAATILISIYHSALLHPAARISLLL